METSRTRTLVYCEVSKISSGIYENKKSGKLTHNEMDSALVDLTDIELRFIILKNNPLLRRLSKIS